MVSLKIFLVLAFAHCVLTDKLVEKHCDNESEDFVPCITEVTQNFFRKHSGGIPEHNLKAIDPITIPEVIIDDQKLGLKLLYKSVKVTGFKDVTLSDVKINQKEGHSQFNMKFDMVAEGDITTEIIQGNSFSGTFKYEANVNADIKYDFTEKKVNNEVTIYNIGPETINCDAKDIKETFNQELLDAFDKDPDTAKIDAEFQKPGATEEYNKSIICQMATVVFRESIDVIRNIGKIGE